MYIVKLGIESIGVVSLLASYSVRNTWLDAIPFMLIGLTLKNNQPIRAKHPIFIAVLGAIMGVGECFFQIKMLEPTDMRSVLYVGTIIAVTFLMIWAINSNCKETIWSRIGAKYSMLIFFLHPIVGWTIQELTKKIYKNVNGISELLLSIIIMVFSTLAAMAVNGCKEWIVARNVNNG